MTPYMMRKLIALMAASGSTPPVPPIPGFTRVKYLQSSGTQYIETGVAPWDYFRFKILTSVNPNQNAANYFGCNNGYWFGATSSNVYTIGGGTLFSSVDGTFKDVEFNAIRDALGTAASSIDITCSIGGQTATRVFRSLPILRNDAYYINNIYEFDGTYAGKTKATQIYGDGTLLRNLTPVIRDIDGKPGMWDLTVTPRLPSGYDELEYLQSSGTQYINSGMQFETSDTVFVNFAYTAVGTRVAIFGSSYRSGGYVALRLSPSESTPNTLQILSLAYTDDSPDTPTEVTVGTFYDVHFRMTARPNSELCLFSNSDGSQGAAMFSKSKIKSFSVYRGNTTLINLIPAKRISDNELGMYDLVSNTFFTNQGTGTFIAGPVVGFYTNAGTGEFGYETEGGTVIPPT